MGFYHLAIGLLCLIVIPIVWTVLGEQLNVTEDLFTGMYPALTSEFQLKSDIFYVSLFIFSIVVIAWIVKTSQEEQQRRFPI